MTNRYENIRPKGEFKVITEGPTPLHNWLRVMSDVMEDPFVDMPTDRLQTVRIGEISLENHVLTKMMSGLSFNPEKISYELRTLIFPKPANSRTISPYAQGEYEQVPDLASILNGVGIAFLPLDEIVPELKKMYAKKYNISFDEDQGKVTFTKPGREQKEFCQLHFSGPAYCLHLEGSPDETEEEFVGKYNEYGELLTNLVKAVYTSSRNPVPDKTYTLAPPPMLDKQINKIRQRISAQKKAMSLADLDGGESLTEEVKEKMILRLKPKETFDDIGGLRKAKESLQEVVDDLKDPSSAKYWGTDISRGTLLYGPPGGGKTLLAKAAANAADAIIYIVNCADVIHHLYGKEQRLINEVFRQARSNNRPSIIFFDEMDALFSHREAFNQITSQNVSVLQVNMDGLIPESNENLVVIGATNRLDAIDGSLLRPGRFNRLIPANLPGPIAREQIFNIHMRLSNEKASRMLFNEIDVKKLSSATKKFSGDDIRELIRRALETKRREQRKGLNPTLVTTNDILKEIADYEEIRIEKKRAYLGFGKEPLEEKEED